MGPPVFSFMHIPCLLFVFCLQDARRLLLVVFRNVFVFPRAPRRRIPVALDWFVHRHVHRPSCFRAPNDTKQHGGHGRQITRKLTYLERWPIESINHARQSVGTYYCMSQARLACGLYACTVGVSTLAVMSDSALSMPLFGCFSVHLSSCYLTSVFSSYFLPLFYRAWVSFALLVSLRLFFSIYLFYLLFLLFCTWFSPPTLVQLSLFTCSFLVFSY